MNFFKNPEKLFNAMPSKPKNPLHSEHLERGVKPIIAGIYEYDSLNEDTKKDFENIIKTGTFVDFDGSSNFIRKNKLKNNETINKETEYVISSLDSKDKYSKRYCDCTGVVLVGLDKKSKKNISILSHQTIVGIFELTKNGEKVFTQDLKNSIKELLEKSEPQTIDAVIFGGDGSFPDLYSDSIKELGNLVSSQLGFEPVVITGPNIPHSEVEEISSTEVYFDTNKRRLYIIKPKQESNESNQSLLPSDLK